MEMPRNTSVTLGAHFDSFVSEKIREGRYQTVSEVVRAGLRRLEEDEARLELLRQSLAAGEQSLLIEDFDGDELIKKFHKKHLD